MWLFKQSLLTSSYFVLASVILCQRFYITVAMNQEFEQQYDEPDELPNEIMLVKESDIMRQMMTAYSDDNNPLRDKHLLVMPGEVSDYFAEIYNHLNIHYVKLQCNGFFY